MALPEDERALLGAELTASVADAGSCASAWNDEIRRRLDLIDRGDAELLDWADAEALIFDADD